MRNGAFAEWEAAGCPDSGARPGEGTVIGSASRGAGTDQLVKYAANLFPTAGFAGDIEDAVLYAGESCTLISDVRPAAEIVREHVREAEATIGRL